MKKLIPFLLLGALAIASCDSGSNSKGNNESKDSAKVSTAPDVSEMRPKVVSLFCRDIGEIEGIPQREVALYLDEMESVLDTIHACETISPENYVSMEIPAKAISAVGGWFAGAGDYFYAVYEGAGVRIYYGWQDESQDGPGYHWKPFTF